MVLNLRPKQDPRLIARLGSPKSLVERLGVHGAFFLRGFGFRQTSDSLQPEAGVHAVWLLCREGKAAQ